MHWRVTVGLAAGLGCAPDRPAPRLPPPVSDAPPAAERVDIEGLTLETYSRTGVLFTVTASRAVYDRRADTLWLRGRVQLRPSGAH